eukprot:1177026-Prorocentrum_minimum.AAC.2
MKDQVGGLSRRDVCLVRSQFGNEVRLVVNVAEGPIHVRRCAGVGEVPVDVQVEQYVFRGQADEGCRLLKHDRAHAPGGQLAPFAPSKAPTSALLSEHDLLLFCCRVI